jgi:hypothetical protein
VVRVGLLPFQPQRDHSKRWACAAMARGGRGVGVAR